MNLKNYYPILAGLTFSSIFGFSFMFTKEGLEVVTPFHLLGFRFGMAAIVLTLLWFFRMIKLNFKGKKMGLLLLLAAISPGLYFIFETSGINLTSSSEAGLMISLIPVVVTMMAALFLRETPNRIQLIYIFLSVAGVIFIILMKGTLDVEKNFLGMLLLGGAVLMAGFYNILSRRLSLNFTPVEITFIMMWVGAIIFNLIALLQQGVELRFYLAPLKDGGVLASILYLSILSSVIAFFMMNYTLSRIEAFQSAVFANLTTVISIIAGIIFRNETFYWFQIIGGIMIIVGVWGTNYYGHLRKKAEELPV